jgi:signal transduction histidine kinase
MVVIKAVLSLAVKPGSFVISYSGISYFLLLILATCFAIRNGIRNASGDRFFWSLLAVGFGLWGMNEGLQLYYELGRHVEVPADSIADSLLFLHVAVLTAAAATVPRSEASDRKPYATILNALLVICFWIFLYGYAVFPYQYLFSSGSTLSYALRFDVLYLCENLALIALVGFLLPRTKQPWKSICFHLLGASALYALSSTVANLAMDYLGGYVNGKLYGLGLIASVCWFVWIPLSAWQVPRTEVKATELEGRQDSRASAWAMLVVVVFSVPIVWELLKRNQDDRLRTLRVVFAVAMIVFLASAAYIKEYLSKRELASDFDLANDRLHLAEEALSGMSRKLIQAQEQERSRIARELHDDIAQRLTMLTLQHEELENNAGNDDLRTGIQELRKQVLELLTNVHTMSHQLHSSKLEHLGLLVAAKSFCAEFREREKVEIDFRSHDLPTGVPPETSLCLFRILQQALNNAAKHSGVKQFEVKLWAASDEIHLMVSDFGKGFDVGTALMGRGLGLTSMKERMRLVDGTLSIDSQPNRGTTIHACVPFASNSLLGLGAGTLAESQQQSDSPTVR